MEYAVQNKDASPGSEYPPLVLRLDPVLELSEDQFFELAAQNRDLRLERNERGEVIVMPPAGAETGNRNANITIQLGSWARRDGTGLTFDSSTGFTLPNGAVRSPDASWVSRPRWETLTERQRQRFAPLCPDFVVELRSPTDSLGATQEKMREYLANGARLGWLIDPEQRRVYIYRPELPVQELETPRKVSGEPVLGGFELDLREVW